MSFTFLIFTVPESPLWLIAVNRKEEARKSLHSITVQSGNEPSDHEELLESVEGKLHETVNIDLNILNELG